MFSCMNVFCICRFIYAGQLDINIRLFLYTLNEPTQKPDFAESGGMGATLLVFSAFGRILLSDTPERNHQTQILRSHPEHAVVYSDREYRQ